MCIKAQHCDAHYWEQCTEIAREAPLEHPKPHTEHRHSVPSSSSFSPSFSRHQQCPQPTKKFPPKSYEHRQPQASSSSPSHNQHHHPTGPSGSSKPKSTDLTGKLTKDGRLTEAEKQCRRDNNLCLWCEAPGHMANKCPLNTKAHSATIPKSSEAAKAVPELGKE